ncbi:MAG: hypothetical protein ACM3MI_08390, partial [Clostridiales bacterium]
KKYDIDDISGFEFNYTSFCDWTGYLYNFQLKENGVLEIKLRKPLSDTTKCSVYMISDNDLVEFKPLLLELLNSDIREIYGYTAEITDQGGMGIELKSNVRQVNTTISTGSQYELPESIKRILRQVSVLQLKYGSLFVASSIYNIYSYGKEITPPSCSCFSNELRKAR